MIRHKSIYDAIDYRRDGYRLLVTRLWPRGIRKTAVDSWDRRLGAPVELIRRKKAGTLTKAELRRTYLAALDREALEDAAALARKRTVTLLCTCRDDLCHRAVLARILERRLRAPKPRWAPRASRTK